MLMQFALSLGHLHLGYLDPRDSHSGSEGILYSAFTSLVGHASGTPARHHSDDDDRCAVCLSMLALGSGVAPAPIATTIPPIPVERVFTRCVELAPIRSPDPPFHSRAPPSIG